MKIPQEWNDKVKTLLLNGAQTMGQDVEGVMSYIEESLTMPEYELVEAFLQWAWEDNDFGFGHGNIDLRFLEFHRSIYQYTLTAQIGRWSGGEDNIEVKELDNTSLAEAAREYIASVPNYRQMGDEVLFWGEGHGPHHLTAVYDIREDKIVFS
tara:strand:+ start:651 stop:1109 length:459 start_codon:yes stop_codon:yes gene_type:complete